MHLPTAPRTIVLAGLFLAAVPPVAAQQSAVDTAQSVTTTQQLQKPLKPANTSGQVPMLYEGELEDLGPQYVLQPQDRPKYFQVMSDLQLYHTNNAALAPGNKLGTDVTVLTLQAAVQSTTAEWFDGWQTQASAGMRYQSYWYGIFSGRNQSTTQPPSFSAVSDLDFQIYSPFVALNFKKDPWYGALGLRYASFNNDNAVSNENFYSEWVPSGTFGYQWNIDSQRILQFQYDGDFRATNTDEKGLHPVGWEDRTDHSISIIYSRILGQNWVIQPSYRLMWSEYTNPDRYRSDIYNTAALMVAYYFNDNASVRAFTSYEWRSSSEFGNNYESWNLGIGFSLNVSF